MPEPRDLTVEILKQIRDEMVTTRTDLGARIDQLRTELGARIDQTNLRIDATNARLTVVRYLNERDHRLAADVDELRSRVDAIEQRLG